MKRKFNSEKTQAPDAVRLAGKLAALEPFYRELGGLGEEFGERLASTQAREEIGGGDGGDNDSVHYANYALIRGFLNKIVYGSDVVDQPVALFIGRAHEAAHAMQYQSCPAMRGDPRNPRAGAVLSPESYLRARELMEREAYAKEALSGALLAFMRPDLREEIARHVACDESLFPDLVEAYINDDGSLPKVLAAASASAMAARIDYQGKDMSFRELYWEKILDEYEEAMELRREGKIPLPATFTRISEHDLLQLGRTYGPSSLGADGRLFPEQTTPDYPEEIRERIAALNEKYGVPPESGLAPATLRLPGAQPSSP